MALSVSKLKKNVKISKERIPAATQLFTPHWIVRYMVENSVGRIWIEHLRAVDPNVDEKATAEKFGWKYYLPEAEQEESVNVKLAEIRTTYKDLKPENIICIDPCMGSGHILIAMFDVLMDIYESAGYDKREAAFEIVEHNIHGLDIDKRAYQLAYFAVMMKGRGYNRRFLNNRDGVTLEPKVYAIEESNEINRNHLQFFGHSMEAADREKAEQQVRYLLDTFVDAREYGSILNVRECDWELIERFVGDLQIDGQFSVDSIGSDETQAQLKRLIKIAENLGRKYDAVVTNPPYMGGSGMGAKLSDYVKRNYPDSKSDMSTVCMEKTLTMCSKHGFMAMINIPVWMFLSSYEKLRGQMIAENTFINMVHPGRGIFGSDFGTTTFVVGKIHVSGYVGNYRRLFDKQGEVQSIEEREQAFIVKKGCYTATQDNFSKIPSSPMAYWVSENLLSAFEQGCLLGSIADSKQGLATADNDRFVREWYEVRDTAISYEAHSIQESVHSGCKWFPYNKGGEFRKWYGNNDYVVNWLDDGFEIRNFYGENGRLRSRPQNTQYYFRPCFSWSLVSSGIAAFRYKPAGHIFDVAGMSCFSENGLFYLLGLCNSRIALKVLEIIAPTINYQCGDIANIPVIFDNENADRVESLVEKNIDISKQDWDSFETSWDFKIHPFLQVNKNSLDINHSVVTKISDSFGLWKAYTDIAFETLKHNEEELNRIFIDIYGLQDELIPEEDDKDVTIRKADLGRDIRSFISYAVGCMFGRYSLAKEGLMFAGGTMTDVYQYHSGTLDGSFALDGKFPMNGKSYYYLDGDDYLIDGDNVIPITDEEYFADDIVSRFVEFVKKVYGEETLEENIKFIADALSNKGNTSREVIRNYFLKDFYADHLKIYQKRPIYWLFDSGKQNGFKALIYMHRYDADTVGRVRTDYLHKTQKYVENAMNSAQYTIDNSASASEKSKATKAVAKYTKQLAEMKIYDEAIAHIANQRIEIDLDDGVKVNYAKFQGVEVAQEGKKAIKVDLLAKIN